MNPLQIRLASLRQRMILVNLWRGSCTLFAVVTAILLIEGLTDWRLYHLPAPLRGLALVATLGALGAVFVRYLYVPMTKRLDDLSLALRIEEIYPELNDNLASAVQFLEEDEENLPGSKIMRKQAIAHALKRADHCDFSNIIDRRGVLVRPLAAVVAGLLAAYFLCYHGAFAAKAMTRLIDPFGNHAWTEIDVLEPPPHVAQGQTFTIKGNLAGIIPEKGGRIEIDDGFQQFDKAIPVDPHEGDPFAATFQLPLDLSQDTAKFRFRILANDGTYPAHGGFTNWIQVKAPPRLVPLDGEMSPQIDLYYPAYTDLRSPKRLVPSLGQTSVEAVAGTKIRWRAAVDRPIVSAWLEFPGGRTECALDASGKIISLENFTPPPTTAVVTINYKDALGLANAEKLELNIFPDPEPSIQLRKPAWSVEKMLPNAQITLDVVAADRIFAIRSVYLEFRRKSANGVEWADKDWIPVPIVHADVVSLFALLGQDFQGLATPMHIRPDFLELTTAWHLRGQFKEGDIVSFRVCADDYNDLVKPRLVGRSRPVDIVIVSDREFRQELDNEFEKVQKQIDLLQQAQEEANNNVKDVMDNKKDGDPEKLRRKLIAAEQKQAAIKEIIANPRDGLLKTLDELKDKMAENKLPPSNLQDNVKALSKELDRLNRVNLPQIEDNLANAQRQLNPTDKQENKAEKKPDTKPEPKKKDPLEQAKNFQDDTSKTLAELAKFLDPWANQQQIKDRIIKLTAQQKDLKRDTEALAQKDRKAPPGKEDLDPRANRQSQLADQADDLLKTIEKVVAKQKGAEGADKLTDVAKIAEKAKLADKMREVRDQLRKTEAPKLSDSVQKQGNIINDLDKMLAALDERPPEEKIEKLLKKQKNAQKDVEKLKKKMDALEQKIKEARKIDNQEEREKKLKELAPEQKALEDEARQLSRELARLQADKASRDLDHAADNMKQAGGKLQDGQDPGGEVEKQIQKDLKQAKADLQEVEEELARERLALIADRLKGIKEREDAAITETERIHKSLVAKNQWSRGLQESLKEAGVSQGNLAQETDTVVEKLAQSPIFEFTLKKAKGSMEEAAKAIAERKERAVAGEPLDKEQLGAENKDQEKIVKLQKDASDRLERLITALKQDPPKKPAPKPKEDDKKPDDKKDDKKDDQQKKIRPSGDGIPPSAEINELINLQDEVRRQTKDFDKRCPDRTNLTDEQEQELRTLEEDQKRIGELFFRLMNRNKQKGDEP